MQNSKYFRFVILLCLTGLCFWQREKIEEGIQRVLAAVRTEAAGETETEQQQPAEETALETSETAGEALEPPKETAQEEEGPLCWEYTTVPEDYFDDAWDEWD